MRIPYADLDIEYKISIKTVKKAAKNARRVLPVLPKNKIQKNRRYPEIMKGQIVDILI